MFAEIILNNNAKALNKIFDYEVPKELEKKVHIGARVFVPFGRSKALEDGFIINLKENSEYANKKIASMENQDFMTEEKINLAKLMAKKYFCNISECIKLMLPPGTKSKNSSKSIETRKDKKVILLKSNDEIMQDIESNVIKSAKQIQLLSFLMYTDNVLISDIEDGLSISRSVISTAKKNGYVDIIEVDKENDFLKDLEVERTTSLPPTEEQKNVIDGISRYIYDEEYKQCLIHGVTGSGKTEVYLQLIERVLDQGRKAIVLVPEISLTYQTVERFVSRFGNDIAILHSKMTVSKRKEEYKRIKQGKVDIVIGARSAIFAPVVNLGLIIIDEEHDESYSSEMTPRYNAKEVARKIAINKQIPLVLGSATPDINTFYKAKQGQIELLTLTKRANQSNLPEIQVIDLREELANGNKTMLSRELYDKIQQNLKNKHQTILFLNRRGFSTFIMCRDCGHTIKCKNCNITLTYHMKENKLKCHYCGYEQENVTICPECGSSKIKYFGTGTQKLEAQIQKFFPNATTIRMDVDTVSKKNSHEEILNQFRNENIDILIGTQMVVKGHHFPNVTLVGVIAADGSLNIDDYRASERTFQILTQVAGRAGRENLQGNVIIQTYNPDHFSIECAKEQNYDKFYLIEENLRKQLKYPPFCDIIVVGISGEKEDEVKKQAEFLHKELYTKIKQYNINLSLYSPRPAPIDKIKNKYRWRIILKGNFDEPVNEMIQEVLKEVYTKGNKARIIVDVNPSSMM